MVVKKTKKGAKKTVRCRRPTSKPKKEGVLEIAPPSEKYIEKQIESPYDPDANKWKPGFSANPAGRPKGSTNGRMKALGILDQLMGTFENLVLLKRALQARFETNPVTFFRDFVMPLLPKESLVRMESMEKAPIRVLFPVAPAAPPAATTETEVTG